MQKKIHGAELSGVVVSVRSSSKHDFIAETPKHANSASLFGGTQVIELPFSRASIAVKHHSAVADDFGRGLTFSRS